MTTQEDLLHSCVLQSESLVKGLEKLGQGESENSLRGHNDERGQRTWLVVRSQSFFELTKDRGQKRFQNTPLSCSVISPAVERAIQSVVVEVKIRFDRFSNP